VNRWSQRSRRDFMRWSAFGHVVMPVVVRMGL
jgi:hypothetical protein